MTASAAAPKARKTRTRKPRAAAVKAVAPKAPKVTAPKRPSTAKLITLSRYVQDAKQRWAIHEFEINALVSDLKKGFTMVQPHAQQLVNQFKN